MNSHAKRLIHERDEARRIGMEQNEARVQAEAQRDAANERADQLAGRVRRLESYIDEYKADARKLERDLVSQAENTEARR